VRSVAWSPDGRHLAVGAVDEALLLDPITGAVRHRLRPGRSAVYVSFVASGHLATQANADAVPARWRARFWDPATGKRTHTLHSAAACATDSEYAWGCRRDGVGHRVRYVSHRHAVILEPWDGRRLGTPRLVVVERPSRTPPLTVRPDGAFAIAGQGARSRTQFEQQLFHRDVQTNLGPARGYFHRRVPKLIPGGFVRVYHRLGGVRCDALGLGPRPTALAFSPTGQHLAAGTRDATLIVLDARCRVVHRLGAKGPSVVAIAFGPPGRVAVLDEAGTLRLWDVTKGRLLTTFQLR
jgi:WD40 repeat protein